MGTGRLQFTISMVSALLFFSRTDAVTVPCNNLSPECLTMSLQAALPTFLEGSTEYGLEPLDPYVLTKLNLNLPEGINIEFRDGLCTGLKSCVVDFARFNGDTLETQFHCNLTIKGKYKSTGRLLMFTIDGDGVSKIKCNNIRIHSNLTFGSRVKDDGHKYLVIKNVNIKHSYDGRVYYYMTNLFRRSPEISTAVLQFMNENWRMIAEEFGDPLVEYGVDSVMKNLRKLLDVVPLHRITDKPLNI